MAKKRLGMIIVSVDLVDNGMLVTASAGGTDIVKVREEGTYRDKATFVSEIVKDAFRNLETNYLASKMPQEDCPEELDVERIYKEAGLA